MSAAQNPAARVSSLRWRPRGRARLTSRVLISVPLTGAGGQQYAMPSTTSDTTDRQTQRERDREKDRERETERETERQDT